MSQEKSRFYNSENIYQYFTSGSAIAFTLNGIRVAAINHPYICAVTAGVAAIKFAYDVYQDEDHDIVKTAYNYYDSKAADLATFSFQTYSNQDIASKSIQLAASHPIIATSIAATTAFGAAIYDLTIAEESKLASAYNSISSDNGTQYSQIATFVGLSANGLRLTINGLKTVSAAYPSIALYSAKLAGMKLIYDLYQDEDHSYTKVLSNYYEYISDSKAAALAPFIFFGLGVYDMQLKTAQLVSTHPIITTSIAATSPSIAAIYDLAFSEESKLGALYNQASSKCTELAINSTLEKTSGDIQDPPGSLAIKICAGQTLMTGLAINGLRAGIMKHPYIAAASVAAVASKFASDVYYNENHEASTVINSYYQTFKANENANVIAPAIFFVSMLAGAVNFGISAAQLVAKHPIISASVVATSTAGAAIYDLTINDEPYLKQAYNKTAEFSIENKDYLIPIAGIATAAAVTSLGIYGGISAVGYVYNSLSTKALISLSAGSAVTGKISYDIYHDKNHDIVKVAQDYYTTSGELTRASFDYTKSLDITTINVLHSIVAIQLVSIATICTVTYNRNPFCKKVWHNMSLIGSKLYDVASNPISKIAGFLSEISPNAWEHLQAHQKIFFSTYEASRDQAAYSLSQAAANYGVVNFNGDLDQLADGQQAPIEFFSSFPGSIATYPFIYSSLASADAFLIGPVKFIFNSPTNHPYLYGAVTAYYAYDKFFGDGSNDFCFETPLCYGPFTPQIVAGIGLLSLANRATGMSNFALKAVNYAHNTPKWIKLAFFGGATAYSIGPLLSDPEDEHYENYEYVKSVNMAEKKNFAGETPDHDPEV